MVVDNFDKIKELMRFDESGDVFYFVQIMQRKKDGADILKNNRIINNYYITSLQYLDDRAEEIRNLCRQFHARAYIGINPCSFKKCCMYGIKELAEINITGRYRDILNLMPTLAGKYPGIEGKEKFWVIDYDSKDKEGVAKLRGFICRANGKDGAGIDKIKTILPTKNGYHLLSLPFDPRGFSEFVKDKFDFEVDIHKSAPTLLYFEEK